MNRSLTVVLGLGVLLACNQRAPGTGRVEPPAAGPQGRLVTTSAVPLAVEAGTEVLVTCTVSRGTEVLTDQSTAVDVTPAPASLLARGSQWVFVPRAAAPHLVQCRTDDGAVRDQRGVTVRVLPAAPAAIDTLLEPALAASGAPVVVSCPISDAFGNLVDSARPTGVALTPGLDLDPPSGAGFTVRGTLIGDYTVACLLDTITDPTPAALQITAGIPGASATTVDHSVVSPEEVVTAGCTVTDAAGNPLGGVPTELAILPADGASAATAGVTIDGHGFSATRAGTYYVFCRVPGYQAGDESPAVVTVLPGLPCTWAVDLLAQDCYWRGRTLPLDYAVFDRWGNPIPDATATLTSTPTGGLEPDGAGGWRVIAEGDFDLSLMVDGPVDDTSCLALPGYAGSPHTASIRVDSTGPAFAITFPGRAATLSNGALADSAISVSGTITDSLSAIESASVVGVDLGADGTQTSIPVSVTQTARWGLNIITGAATDACGNRSIAVQSYLRSANVAGGGYFTAATSPNAGARAAQGILAQLNQTVIDDLDRTDLDDLASIGERILQTQDFNTLVAPGYDFTSHYHSNSCSFPDTWADIDYLVERPSPSPPIVVEGPYLISLQAVDGGLRLQARIGDSTPGRGFEFPIRLWARDRECVLGLGPTTIATIDVQGTAYANQIDATATLGVSLVSGQPQVTVASMTINSSDLGLDMSCASWIDWLCDWIANTVVDLLSNMIEDALEDVLRDEIPPLVEELLAGFALESDFVIPPPLDMQLLLASALDRIVFCGPTATGLTKPAGCPATSPNPGYGQLGLYAQVYPAARGANIPVAAIGAIKKSGALPAFSASAYEFGMGLKDDMMNQVLWALWYGGGLDLDAADISGLVAGSGLDGVEMSMVAHLPPVLMPGRDGYEVQLGVGDLEIQAAVDLGALLGAGAGAGTINVGLYLSAVLGGSVDINQATNELTVLFDDQPQIEVEVFAIDDPGYQAVMSDLFAELLGLILPNLIGSVLQSFPIPEIDLGGIANLPPGTDAVWTLTGASIDRTADYYRITGSLQ